MYWPESQYLQFCHTLTTTTDNPTLKTMDKCISRGCLAQPHWQNEEKKPHWDNFDLKQQIGRYFLIDNVTRTTIKENRVNVDTTFYNNKQFMCDTEKKKTWINVMIRHDWRLSKNRVQDCPSWSSPSLPFSPSPSHFLHQLQTAITQLFIKLECFLRPFLKTRNHDGSAHTFRSNFWKYPKKGLKFFFCNFLPHFFKTCFVLSDLLKLFQKSWELAWM